MLSYALEQFRRGRGITQKEFTVLLGVSKKGYDQVVGRRSSANQRFRGELAESRDLSTEEKQLLHRAYIAVDDNLEDFGSLKHDIEQARYKATPKYDVESPNRIRNNKEEFYKLLNSIPNVLEEDPNSQRLQRLRQMMGEKQVWDNPEELWGTEEPLSII